MCQECVLDVSVSACALSWIGYKTPFKPSFIFSQKDLCKKWLSSYCPIVHANGLP